MFLGNFGIHIQVYTLSQSRRSQREPRMHVLQLLYTTQIPHKRFKFEFENLRDNTKNHYNQLRYNHHGDEVSFQSLFLLNRPRNIFQVIVVLFTGPLSLRSQFMFSHSSLTSILILSPNRRLLILKFSDRNFIYIYNVPPTFCRTNRILIAGFEVLS
jgi:hypothetical protein